MKVSICRWHQHHLKAKKRLHSNKIKLRSFLIPLNSLVIGSVLFSKYDRELQ